MLLCWVPYFESHFFAEIMLWEATGTTLNNYLARFYSFFAECLDSHLSEDTMLWVAIDPLYNDYQWLAKL
jgi:hypothetical protein